MWKFFFFFFPGGRPPDLKWRHDYCMLGGMMVTLSLQGQVLTKSRGESDINVISM